MQPKLTELGFPPEVLAVMREIPSTALGNLACPFCGEVKLSVLVFEKTETKPEVRIMQCDVCGATGPNTMPREAEEAWNTRAFGGHLVRRMGNGQAGRPTPAVGRDAQPPCGVRWVPPFGPYPECEHGVPCDIWCSKCEVEDSRKA